TSPLHPMPGVNIERDQSRELFDVRGEVGTSIDRVYPVDWFGLQKVKHTIEPTLQYLYIPDVSQEDLPLFDEIDRINHRNMFTYATTSRWTENSADAPPAAQTDNTRVPLSSASVRELARLSVFQSADIDRDIHPQQGGGGADDHFSDIDITGRINPS